MSLFGGITDLIFGKPEAPEADFDSIIRLMQEGDKYSNPNQRGLLSGWEMSIGDDGRLTQQQTLNPALQPAMDSFIGRANEGTEDEGLNALKQARLAAMMGPRGPRPMPERRQRPMNRSEYTDDAGNSIPKPDWWRV